MLDTAAGGLLDHRTVGRERPTQDTTDRRKRDESHIRDTT
jgi:hypothetical protein